jgi:hypothetical protein
MRENSRLKAPQKVIMTNADGNLTEYSAARQAGLNSPDKFSYFRVRRKRAVTMQNQQEFRIAERHVLAVFLDEGTLAPSQASGEDERAETRPKMGG